jgi:hypothetical protein
LDEFSQIKTDEGTNGDERKYNTLMIYAKLLLDTGVPFPELDILLERSEKFPVTIGSNYGMLMDTNGNLSRDTLPLLEFYFHGRVLDYKDFSQFPVIFQLIEWASTARSVTI